MHAHNKDDAPETIASSEQDVPGDRAWDIEVNLNVERRRPIDSVLKVSE